MKRISLGLILICCITLVFWAEATAAKEKRHPIDIEVGKWLDQDPSTHGQIQAFGKGCELWDKELNRVYQELMQALGSDVAAMNALRESQRQWLIFRDKEFEILMKLYEKKEGTMYRPMQVADRLEIVQHRARELADRLRLLKE